MKFPMNKAVFSGIFCLLILGAVLSGGKSPDGGGCSRESVKPSFHRAPDFNLPFWDGEGRTLTLSEAVKEQPVLLVFWATWCPTCVAEVKTLNEWQTNYGARGLKILSVSVQETADKIRKFSKTHTLTYPCLLDTGGDVAERYGVDSLPTVVLLAKGGEILYYGYHLPQDVERLLPVQS